MPVVLETPRMTLRHMTMDDVDDLLQIFADPEVMRYYPSTKDRTETIGWVEWTLRSYKMYGHGLWIATLKHDNSFAGQCGLTVQHIDDWPEVEIGYLFLRKLWGQGLATEAAQACRNYGFNQLGLDRLISLIDVHNIASRRVAEKNGMALEREIDKWHKRVCVYAIQRHTDALSERRDG